MIRYLVLLEVEHTAVAPYGAGTITGEQALDLGVAPVTFDFASYLAAAEVERRARQLASIFVVIVPGGYHGLRKETPDYEETTDVAARHWRVRNLVLPILALLPSVAGHAVFASRAEAARLIPSGSTRLYPSDYRMALPCQPLKRVIFDHAAKGTPIWPMFRATEGPPSLPIKSKSGRASPIKSTAASPASAGFTAATGSV